MFLYIPALMDSEPGSFWWESYDLTTTILSSCKDKILLDNSLPFDKSSTISIIEPSFEQTDEKPPEPET